MERDVIMSLSGDLTAFIIEHREHGRLVGDTTEPGLAGYQVWITCPCGVTFRRQVTAPGALVDLAELAWRN
jgi:hypothetical protein